MLVKVYGIVSFIFTEQLNSLVWHNKGLFTRRDFAQFGKKGYPQPKPCFLEIPMGQVYRKIQ